ncbi:MAG: zinc-dependent alcohol dehydrogenase family protein [Planctomycetota bacterium]|nr:zinc-dependent alcohol dehydrogenase family protein [Planctomycetota bacterium]
MRAARLHRTAPVAERPLVLEDVPEPEPGPGELLVRVSVCGVCRTDLHVIEGDLPEATRPVVPGHMVVGTVESIGAGGDGVGGFGAGERVGIAWMRGTCGSCDYCAEGSVNLCLDARFTGYHVDGGYAELAVVPAEWAYAIPAAFADEEAAPLLCAGIIGYRALRLSEVRPGQRLGLWGFGNSAHIVLQIALARGCEVYVSSLRKEHQELARELGAVWVGGAGELPPEELHAGILFAPAGELVPPALRALRRGGTLACAGIHMSPIPPIDYDADLFGERTLRSVTANTRADGVELLSEAARIPIRPQTTLFPLEEANEALIRLKEGAINGAAVLRVAD